MLHEKAIRRVFPIDEQYLITLPIPKIIKQTIKGEKECDRCSMTRTNSEFHIAKSNKTTQEKYNMPELLYLCERCCKGKNTIEKAEHAYRLVIHEKNHE